MTTTAVTTWIAVLGVALGAASLTRHVVSFLLSAGRIKVSADSNMRIVDQTRPRASGDSVITITVRNVGRMPVSVETAWLRCPGTDYYLFVPNPGPSGPGPELPRTVTPGHSATWALQRDASIRRLTRKFSGTVTLRPLVVLGNGKSTRGKAVKIDLSETQVEEGG